MTWGPKAWESQKRKEGVQRARTARIRVPHDKPHCGPDCPGCKAEQDEIRKLTLDGGEKRVQTARRRRVRRGRMKWL